MLDQDNTFDDKAEHKTTANSTNVINTQSALSDLGAGKPVYIVAAVTSNKTGGHDVDVYLFRTGKGSKVLENWDLEPIITDAVIKSVTEAVM